VHVDFGRTVDDYARHRAGFPNAFFERLQGDGVISSGERLLDLGTGTGTIARGFARWGLEVTGIDIAPPLLETARRLAEQIGVSVHFLEARAEETGLPDGGFEVITAGQCWHWFDRPRVAAEAQRLLVSGGRVVIAHFDWVPLPGNVVEATEQLILKHNPDWKFDGGTGLYPEWLTDLAVSGFRHLETYSFDQVVPYSHLAWRGRMRASAGIGASLPEADVERFDQELKALLARDFPDDPLEIPHRLWTVIGWRI
jgi:ubiquinone/menaquinone biosynthesis C-methylase UbiE